jgi:hypothetical protein
MRYSGSTPLEFTLSVSSASRISAHGHPNTAINEVKRCAYGDVRRPLLTAR